MSRGDYDDRDDDRRDDDRDRGDRRRDEFDDRPRGRAVDAKKKVSLPGLFLILTGGFNLLFQIGFLALAFTNPNVIVDWYQKALIDSQPAGPQKQQLQQQFDQQKEGMRLDSPFNIGSYAVGALLSLLAVVGGFAMRGLSGYGLSLTGAIAAMIPYGCCCTLTLPFGIWGAGGAAERGREAGIREGCRRTARRHRRPPPDG